MADDAFRLRSLSYGAQVGQFATHGLDRFVRRTNPAMRMVGERMSRWLVGITMSVIIVVSSDALSQQSLQELERSSQFEQALRAVDAIKHRKRLQCVMSTANAPICECLAQKLPVDTYVRSYVSIVNRDKDGQDYGQLSATDKVIVDRCVTDGR